LLSPRFLTPIEEFGIDPPGNVIPSAANPIILPKTTFALLPEEIKIFAFALIPPFPETTFRCQCSSPPIIHPFAPFISIPAARLGAATLKSSIPISHP